MTVVGKDARGQRRWSHSIRSGSMAEMGMTGVRVGGGLVLCPAGALLQDWEGATVSVNGRPAVPVRFIDPSSLFSSSFLSFSLLPPSLLFALLTEQEPDVVVAHQAENIKDSRVVAPHSLDSSVWTCHQYPLFLTRPHWGLLTQPCRIVGTPEPGVALIDVSCYAGGEGGLVVGPAGASPLMVVSGFAQEGTPTGLSVCVEISRILGGGNGGISLPLSVGSKDPMIAASVLVSGGDKWGTGFCLADGVVVTAAHVVCGKSAVRPEFVRVKRLGRRSVRAKVVLCWPGGWLDFCVLQMAPSELSNGPVLQLASDEPPLAGSQVRLLSATQWGCHLDLHGAVMSSSTTPQNLLQLVCNVPAWGGCSGSPLISLEDDRVLGIALSTASHGRSRIARLSLCLPVRVWRSLIQMTASCMDDGALSELLPPRQLFEAVWGELSPEAPLPSKWKEVMSKL